MKCSALVLLLFSPWTSLLGQWGVGIDVGVARYFGATRSTTGAADAPTLRPYRPTTLGIRIGRDVGHARVDLAVSYGSPGLAGEADDAAFVFTNDAWYLTASPEVTVRVVNLGSGVIRLGAGFDATYWNRSGLDPLILAGGHGVLAYEWPVVPHLLGSVQLGLAISPSVFKESELPAELERRMMVRPSISLGLRYH